MKKRIYICHTYYHVYVSFLKEFALPKEEQGHATMMLSKMSTDFEDLKDRLERVHYFEKVIEFDERRDTEFPELAQYKVPSDNFLRALWNRIIFTRKYAALEAEYVPVNLREYDDIYVFCDSDPIGYYLNQNRIPYHALEDGLNCLSHYDSARYDNKGHFGIKAFFSQKLNLIFIQNGYGKYCIDMEVNDISLIPYPCEKYVEVPRQALAERLTREEKDILLHAFVRDMDSLSEMMRNGEHSDNKILILTDPLCDLDTRRQIFSDIINQYGKGAQVYIKPHPRDVLDYHKYFGEYIIIDPTVPMEMFNFMDVTFEKVYAVLTVIDAITFAKEKIRLGEDFMDRYETPAVHRQNENL
ncbi:MAG: glycosyltransferase family 52 protein [Lachnospiraceae bacterium]|nr:glycosyltransferase family 52 protein [Lachnospiraceae bacterium]